MSSFVICFGIRSWISLWIAAILSSMNRISTDYGTDQTEFTTAKEVSAKCYCKDSIHFQVKTNVVCICGIDTACLLYTSTLLSGGVGTPIGTLFGVLIKGTISSLITTQGTLSSWWVRIILSLLLCFFIVIQSVIASMKKKAK